MCINVDLVYICHYAKLESRKSKMIDQLRIAGIDDYMFVELFDKDSWDAEDIQYDYPLIDIDKKLGVKMNDGEKSLALKHAWIIMDNKMLMYELYCLFFFDVIYNYAKVNNLDVDKYDMFYTYLDSNNIESE